MAIHNLYLVKDLARLTGLSIETVKYYLKIGLIFEVGRSPETNYRYFDESTINRVNSIIGLRRDRYPIKKIRELLEPEGSQVELL